MRAEVAERAIVRRVTMKDTTATDVQCVLAIIVHRIIIKVRKAISQEKVAIVHAIIAMAQDTPQKGEQEGAIVLALKATILMQSTA